MNLYGKFYVELSYTIAHHEVAFGTEGDITVFKDEGGVGVSVAIQSHDLSLALHKANVAARRHLGVQYDPKAQPWRVVILDAPRMEEHYAKVNAAPAPAPSLPVAV